MSHSSPFHTLGRLIAPSSGSIITALFTSLVTVAITMYYTVFKGSTLEAYSRQLAETPNDLRTQLEWLNIAVNSSEYVATASVFVIWCVVGAIIYALSLAVIHIYRGGALFVGTLIFVSSDQKPHLLVEVTIRLLVRLLGAVGLFAIYQLTLLGLVPIIYTLQKLKIQPEVLSIAFSVTLTIIITMVLMHLLTVVLRLLTLRIRLLF